MSEAAKIKQDFKIFRAKEAPNLNDAGCMTFSPVTELQQEGINRAMDAGYAVGVETKILVDLPGFSLAHAWLKKDYPLALHSHDTDCLYYIISGSLKIGSEELGPQDSFFIPEGVPYTYRPGPKGVEVLEFRHKGTFNFVNFSKSAAFWNKAVDTIAANVNEWATALPPSAS